MIGELPIKHKLPIKSVLVSKSELKNILNTLADRINNDYKDIDHKLIILCVLKGSLMVTSDLVRRLKIPFKIEFIGVSTYGDEFSSSQKIKLYLDLNRDDLSECEVLIVEDIVDSGFTLNFLINHLKSKNVKKIKICTLLRRDTNIAYDHKIDYIGKTIGDGFVVGYGLDYVGRYRELPYIIIADYKKDFPDMD